jgi:hypothetical protein
MWLLEEVATIDENVRELRRRRGRAFAQRNARSVRELQTLGIADPDFNPLLAATALPAMVGTDGLYDLPRQKWSLRELVKTLTRLWANALRIPHDPPRRPPRKGRARNASSRR